MEVLSTKDLMSAYIPLSTYSTYPNSPLNENNARLLSVNCELLPTNANHTQSMFDHVQTCPTISNHV